MLHNKVIDSTSFWNMRWRFDLIDRHLGSNREREVFNQISS